MARGDRASDATTDPATAAGRGIVADFTHPTGAAMTDCRTFNGVDQSIFACVKQRSLEEHGTIYEPAVGNQGTATTKVPLVGTVVVSFNLEPATESITYCVVSKPWIVSASQIFDGIGETINSCRKK